MPEPTLIACCSKMCAALINTTVAPCIKEAHAPYTYEALQEKWKELKEKLQAVDNKRTSLGKKTKGTAVYNRDAIKWEKEASVTSKNIEEKMKDIERDIKATCASGCLPNCFRRKAARGVIQKEIEKADKLIEGYMPVLKGYSYDSNETVLKTRGDDIEKIWKCISANVISKKDEVQVVCIHGIAGVGKTVVAEAVCNKALFDEHEKFGYVVWVEASYNMKLESLQKNIMRRLDIPIDINDDDNYRATKIRDEFVRRKKCLVIFDFLWDDLTLRQIGIPEREADAEGIVCKVILTSRAKLMCSRIPEDGYFEIKPISEEWNFFKSALGRNLSSSEDEVVELVKKAVEGCAGLPREIMMLASRIKVYSQNSKQLASILKEILSSRTRFAPSTNADRFKLKYSYNKLEKTIQQCFLYCSLYPKGFPIQAEQLIDNWILDGLLDTPIGSLADKRRRGRVVLTTLKCARLLEKAGSDDSNSREAVKMLGLYHDMALDIMLEEGVHVFIDSGNDLTDFPPINDPNGSIKRASFMKNKLGVLKDQPNCVNLSTLLLCYNPLDLCSDSFFTGMPNLKLIDMSHTNILNLPSSICNLKLLRVLRLRNCLNLRSLPCLSNLVELIVLDLSGTPLEELPLGMDKLKKLIRLDLSYTKLAKFQAGLVKALESLQELLLMMNDAEGYSWASEKTRSSSREAYVEELACLDGLRALQLNFLNKEVFNEYMKAIPSTMPRPRALCFKFCVGGINTNGNLGENSISFSDDYPIDIQLPEGTMELYLSTCRGNLSPNNTLERTGISFQNLKVLNMFDCSGLTYLFSFEMLQCLQNLEKIYVWQCWSIVGIIKPTENSNTNPPTVSSYRLSKLQELVLIDLPLLESICPDQQQLECPAFRRFSVWKCDKLKRLPLVESKATTMIKLRGRSFKLDDTSYLEREEVDIPEDIVSFMSVKKPKSSPSSMPGNAQVNVFKRKATEKNRTAAILSENEGNTIPLTPQSSGYIVRRLNNASGLLRELQRRIGVLFIN